MSDGYQATYIENDTRVWRASSFGACEQYLARVAKGQTPDLAPDWLEQKMAASADLEGDVLAALEGRGYRVLGHEECEQYGKVNPRKGQIQTEMKVPGGVIRCHPDAIVQSVDDAMTIPEQHMVTEVKVLSEKTTDDPLKRVYYTWQVSIEMATTGLPGLFVVAYKDEDGVLVYEGDRIKLDIRYLNRAPKSKGLILARASRLKKLIDADELPPCDYKMFPCGFFLEHSGGIWEDDVLELEAKVTLELDKLARDWRIAKNQMDDAEKRKKAASKKMKEVLVGAGAKKGDRVKLPDYRLTLAEGKSTSYSKDLASADGVDLEKYKVVTPYEYVLPKFTGEE